MRASLLLSLLTLAVSPVAGQTPPAAVPAAAPAAARSAPKPCLKPEHRQFDFWLGEWEVTDYSGKIVGHSHIESILHGCVVAEHWSSGGSGGGDGDGDGKSFNIYNSQVGHWEQFWVDAQGNRLSLSGGLVGASMVLAGHQEVADTKTGLQQRERITWTPNPDGSVRQLWESSIDDGKSWTVAFDGLYRHPASK